MRRLLVDATQCAGCRCCEMACSFRHEGVFSPSLSRVAVIKDDKHGIDYPVYCRQCEPCPPAEMCPTGALSKGDRGTVQLDENVCINCGVCVSACRFEAIKLDEASMPILCDLCGGDPACVLKCPTKAMTFQESDFFSEQPDEAYKKLRRRWGLDA